MTKPDKKRAARKTLKVPDNASPDEIKSAFRRAVMKYHPDRNVGNGEAAKLMQEAQQAYDELTGKEREPDNTHAYIYNLFHAILGFLISDMAQKGVDPKTEDLITIMRQMINHQIGEQKKRERELLNTRRTAESLLGRWKKGKIKEDLEHIVKLHISDIERNLEAIDREVQLRKDALQLLADCTFDFKAAKKQMIQTATMTWNFTPM